MSPRQPQHRKHYCLSLDQVCDAFGIEGEPIRAWTELDSDFVHIMTEDSTAPPSARGSYIDIETITSGYCDSCQQDAHLSPITYNVCDGCAPSTTS